MKAKNTFRIPVLVCLIIALITPIVMAQPKATTGKIEIIQPEGLWDPRPRFAQVVKVGNQIYIAGQTSVDEKGNLVGKGDIEAQARQVFKNLQKCLEAVGAGFDRVVKLNIYALNIDTQREAIGKIRNEFLAQKPVAVTFVQVSRLVNPDWLLEIEAIAVLE
jgi:enamine deaminase RidA (YjgF/YER057c/UK114 family)